MQGTSYGLACNESGQVGGADVMKQSETRWLLYLLLTLMTIRKLKIAAFGS